MGFLNHSTNNIIVDAVLTDKGRELLSSSGRLDISRFALFDDEVDYSMIKKYGVIIGKEKIEKTTPVFEAITGQNVSLKYPLRTFDSNTTQNINKYPYLERSGTSAINLQYSGTSVTTTASITIKTKLSNVSTSYTLADDLQDDRFSIAVFNKLLKVEGLTNNNEKGDKTIYRVSSTSVATSANAEFSGQKEITFSISLMGTFTDDAFREYSVFNDSNKIHTQITITGNKSGAVLVLPVTITRG